MAIVVNILFTILSVVGGALLLANITLIALKLAHRKAEARRIEMRLAPIASYFKLGGTTSADRERAKHA